MSEPLDVLRAVAAKLEQVTGLRCHATAPGSVTTPAAVCELAGLTAPSTLSGTATYTIKVILLVQLGDQRNSQERTLELIDPAGTVATSALVALLDYSPASEVKFEGPGLLDYAGQQYHGGIFTVTVMA